MPKMDLSRLTLIVSVFYLSSTAAHTHNKYDDAYLQSVMTDLLNVHGEAKIKEEIREEALKDPTLKERLRDWALGKRFKAGEIKSLDFRDKLERQLQITPAVSMETNKRACIDSSSIKKLDVVAGSEKMQESVLSRVGSHLATANGKIAFTQILTQPITTIDVVISRRDSIRSIAQQPDLHKKLHNCFEQISKEAEEGFLLFQDPQSALENKLLSDFYLSSLLMTPINNSFINGNRNSIILNGREFIRNFWEALGVFNALGSNLNFIKNTVVNEDFTPFLCEKVEASAIAGLRNGGFNEIGNVIDIYKTIFSSPFSFMRAHPALAAKWLLLSSARTIKDSSAGILRRLRTIPDYVRGRPITTNLFISNNDIIRSQRLANRISRISMEYLGDTLRNAFPYDAHINGPDAPLRRHMPSGRENSRSRSLNIDYKALLFTEPTEAERAHATIVSDQVQEDAQAKMRNLGLSNIQRMVEGGYLALDTLMTAWRLYTTFHNLKFRADVIKHLQTKLISAATYLSNMQVIYTLVSADPILQKLPCVADLEFAVNPDGKCSKKLAELIKLLSSNTFAGDASYFSSRGRILAAYKLIYEVQNEFAPALRAMGELESYVALASLIREHDNKKVHFTFADFITDSQKPYIHAEDMWNVFVSPEKAIPSGCTFGGGDQMLGMILSGPNTSGKSTFLKAFITNTILAQTFGIAAASSYKTTPFAIMICHLNIADDTASGVSLWKAEVARAQELMSCVESLPKDQFAAVVIDEIFTATSPDQAEELAFKFIKKLASFENCVFIDATHFKRITDIVGVSKTCQNYHLGARVDGYGKVLEYTRELKPGISPVKNAEQIATEAGIAF